MPSDTPLLLSLVLVLALLVLLALSLLAPGTGAVLFCFAKQAIAAWGMVGAVIPREAPPPVSAKSNLSFRPRADPPAPPMLSPTPPFASGLLLLLTLLLPVEATTRAAALGAAPVPLFKVVILAPFSLSSRA